MIGMFRLTSFIFGLAYGSFLNVVAQRTIEGKKWWGRERSVCESCGRTLSFMDLIPLLSYVFLKGRCRGCNAKIGISYLLVELIMGFSMLVLAWLYGPTYAFILSFVLWSCLFLSSLTDMYSGYVYDWLVLPFLAIGLLLRVFVGWQIFLDGILGACICGFLILLIMYVSKGGMGSGDAIVAAAIGGVMGAWMGCLALYISFMCGGLTALSLLLVHKVGRKDHLPMVPFFAIGSFCTFLFGAKILAFLDISPGWPWIF